MNAQQPRDTMTLRAGKNLIVDVRQVPEAGAPWQVRVYKKILGIRRAISSDWFLDERQATTFAERIAMGLDSESPTEVLKNRKPGWTASAQER
jgi:hypothetical protein